ncbi:MAG: sigma-54-dependent Fis family transcriptional regulator, partial [Desulfohalobiaceae bacterium]|nr:sigma-54-dependent Fis family transcriptional regulator [Desulfohalobiaceae bacterium]
LNAFYGKCIQRLQTRVVSALVDYAWPGNIRELENLIERAYLLEKSSEIGPQSLPAELFDRRQPSLTEVPVDITQPLANIRTAAVQQAELTYLRCLLAANHGRIDRSAAQAGVSVRQLYNLMHKYHLDKETFKDNPDRASQESSFSA